MPFTPVRTVLVVDDRRDVADTLADMCRALGYAAEVAADGEAMLGLLERHRPDAVIVDVMMPQQDGFEALKDISVHNPALPVLLVTGHGGDWLEMGQTLGRARGLTSVHTLAKPIRLHALRRFLEAVGGEGRVGKARGSVS